MAKMVDYLLEIVGMLMLEVHVLEQLEKVHRILVSVGEDFPDRNSTIT